MTAFQTAHAFSGFSVDDIDAARSFYGDTLGMDVTTNAMGFLDIKLPDGASTTSTRRSTTSTGAES